MTEYLIIFIYIYELSFYFGMTFDGHLKLCKIKCIDLLDYRFVIDFSLDVCSLNI